MIDKNPIRHREIFLKLESEIRAGHFKPGEKLPSENVLAQRFNASRPTIARAFRDLQQLGLIHRRAGSGTYVSEGKVETKTRLVGLLMPDLETSEFSQNLAGEIAGIARAGEFGVLWSGATGSRTQGREGHNYTKRLCEQLIEQNVAGVFFNPFELIPDRQAVNARIVTTLRGAGIPVVLLDQDYLSFPGRSQLDLVGIDHFGAGFLLAEHLIKLGCRKIWFVARPFSAPTVEARIAGCREARVRHGLEDGENWVFLGNPEDRKFLNSLLAGRRADAFICANDHTAAVLMKSLESEGIRVPAEVRVVGFDDLKYATLLRVPLTTIHQPCRDLAEIAFRCLKDRLASPSLPPRQITLQSTLIVRESCGAYLGR